MPLLLQLRNLVWATSKHDVYLISNYSLMHWSSISQNLSEVLDFSGHIAPSEVMVHLIVMFPFPFQFLGCLQFFSFMLVSCFQEEDFYFSVSGQFVLLFAFRRGLKEYPSPHPPVVQQTDFWKSFLSFVFQNFFFDSQLDVNVSCCFFSYCFCLTYSLLLWPLETCRKFVRRSNTNPDQHNGSEESVYGCWGLPRRTHL